MSDAPIRRACSVTDDLVEIDRDLAVTERRIATIAGRPHTSADRAEIRNVQRHAARLRDCLDARLAPDPVVRNLALIWRRAQGGRSSLRARD